jgi:hypothetical protein
MYHIGWDGYLSKEKVKIRKVVLNEERLFSLSSITSPASRKEESKKNIQKNILDGKSYKKKTYKKKNENDENEKNEDINGGVIDTKIEAESFMETEDDV